MKLGKAKTGDRQIDGHTEGETGGFYVNERK